MAVRTAIVGLLGSLALVGCVETAEFGGSGGSFGGTGGSGGFGGSWGTNQISLSRARDICVNAARQQGLIVARVDSVSKYGFGNGAPRGVQVNMEVRRDQFTVNTEPRVCRYVYRDGSTDISRT